MCVCEKGSLDGLCNIIAIHDHFSVMIRVVGHPGTIVPDTMQQQSKMIPALSLNKDKLQQVEKTEKSRVEGKVDRKADMSCILNTRLGIPFHSFLGPGS